MIITTTSLTAYQPIEEQPSNLQRFSTIHWILLHVGHDFAGDVIMKAGLTEMGTVFE